MRWAVNTWITVLHSCFPERIISLRQLNKDWKTPLFTNRKTAFFTGVTTLMVINYTKIHFQNTGAKKPNQKHKKNHFQNFEVLISYKSKHQQTKMRVFWTFYELFISCYHNSQTLYKVVVQHLSRSKVILMIRFW